MKKAIILLFILLSIPAFADWGKNISSTEGWNVYCIQSSSFNASATFHIENKTGIPAFDVKVIIYCTDFHGKNLESISFKEEGPIHTWWEKEIILPSGTYKMTAEVFWKDKYLDRTSP